MYDPRSERPDQSPKPLLIDRAELIRDILNSANENVDDVVSALQPAVSSSASKGTARRYQPG